ncbi:MAG: hypothetical protein JNM36_14745, partial [Chitinophagales bacterium]|nr:hypothetical protein [Chitinophagales bacterium]
MNLKFFLFFAILCNVIVLRAQSFTGLNSTYCSNDAPVTLTGSEAPDGSFTGSGVTDNGNGTATFNPSTAGTGGTITYTVPMWTSVSAGDYHSLAVRADGTLWAWGYNGYGELGIGNAIDQASPVQVGTATDWASVSAGAYHSLAIKT